MSIEGTYYGSLTSKTKHCSGIATMCCAKNRRCASSRVTKSSWYYLSNCTPSTYRKFDLKPLVIEPECSKWRSFRTMLTWTTSSMRWIIHGFTNIVVFSTYRKFYLKPLVIEPECSKWRSFRTMLTWTTSYMRWIIHGFTNIVVFSTM